MKKKQQNPKYNTNYELPNDYSRCCNFTCPYAPTCLRIKPPSKALYYSVAMFNCTEEKEHYIGN